MPQLKLRELGFGVGAGHDHESIDRVIAFRYRQQRPKLCLLLIYYRVRALRCVDSVIFDMLVISQGQVDIEQPRPRVMVQARALPSNTNLLSGEVTVTVSCCLST